MSLLLTPESLNESSAGKLNNRVKSWKNGGYEYMVLGGKPGELSISKEAVDPELDKDYREELMCMNPGIGQMSVIWTASPAERSRYWFNLLGEGESMHDLVEAGDPRYLSVSSCSVDELADLYFDVEAPEKLRDRAGQMLGEHTERRLEKLLSEVETLHTRHMQKPRFRLARFVSDVLRRS